MEQYKVIWEEALQELERTINLISFQSWIQPLQPIDINGNKLVLSTSSEMAANVITEKYLGKIRDALLYTKSGISDIVLFVGGSRQDYLSQRGIEPVETFKSMEFNPRYTFETFVVGNSNKFVQAAALAVAKNPGSAYNPLFIYGGTGLGKTHIMNAIGNYIKKNMPQQKVLYVTGEIFTNELIDSIKAGRRGGGDFRNKYRNVDVLIVDDIQFIANKQGTQEEFFHTFNELYSQNKQIVIASDKPPKDIAYLEERLRTRFEGGLIADVQPPDIETKIAILKQKAAEEHKVLDIEVLTMIADESVNDVRSLEGRLTKVLFLAALENKPVTADFAREALEFSTATSSDEMTTDTIINAVCDYFGLSKADLIGKKRNKELVEPRQICIYLITEFMNIPLTAIGEAMGGRDHTTVIHARDKVFEQLNKNTKLEMQVNDIRNLILKK